MELRAIISAGKADIRVGPWRSGKVPKADFPLAKNALRLGTSFEWCVIAFRALGAECRVLVLFSAGKEKYDAVLGTMSGGTLRVLCSYQYHATEPGWHVHAACESVDGLPAGYVRGPWVRRIPAAGRRHRRKDFGVDGKVGALRFALDHYRIEAKGPLL